MIPTGKPATKWICICSVALIASWICACNTSEQGITPSMKTPAMSGSTQADLLQGIWKLQTLTEVAPDGSEHSMKNVDSLLMFINGYHSMMLIHSDEPRTPFVAQFTATDEEKVAAFNTSTANAGTYEVSDGKLLMTHPLAAKNPGFTGGHGEYDFRIEGDTLYLTMVGVYMSTGVQTLPGPNVKLVEYEFVRVK